MALSPPIISQADPLSESETSVDPLGLARTYERLADQILPAVTVRMGRIRFVTAMCLGALVCKDYDEEAVASDGITPPWLVFEWFVIEALARVNDEVRGQRIPGLLKAQACMNAQRPLSAPLYLKTPKVFGFNGIFRRLATRSNILDDDLRLDDGGWDLLRAWEHDQDLPGLIEGRRGAGAALVRDLRDAVAKGMAEGHTVKRPTAFWEAISAHLHPGTIGKHPGTIGKREGVVLRDRVRASSVRTREYVDSLTAHGAVTRDTEAHYLRSTTPSATDELAPWLRAIDAYESACRPIDDAFDLIRVLSGEHQGAAIDAMKFGAHPEAPKLVARLQQGLKSIQLDPVLLGWDEGARTLLAAFGPVDDPTKLFHAVLDHHDRIQKGKPPDGKRPWIERGRNDSALVRPGYGLTEMGSRPAYVHDYRTATVSGFLIDVGAIN